MSCKHCFYHVKILFEFEFYLFAYAFSTKCAVVGFFLHINMVACFYPDLYIVC